MSNWYCKDKYYFAIRKILLKKFHLHLKSFGIIVNPYCISHR